MEITKAKNFDTNGVAEFESVDEETHEVTPDMKYIKWPSKKKVFSELVSVAVASVIISIEEVDGINDKLKEIIYQTQKSVDEDELTFKQSIAKSKECYVLLRVVRKIAKKKDKCEKQAIDNEFAIELDKDELKLFKGLFAEMFK